MCYDCIDDDALEEARRELRHRERGESAVEGATYVYACKLSEIPANGSRGKSVEFADTEIALFNIKGSLYATSNICPHEHSPLLAEGHIDKEQLVVTCPLHGWAYRIDTGEAVAGDSGITTYRLKVIDDEVWIEEP